MAEEHSLMYVPEELEENILVRVPVKSIVRFKSVCRRWHSLFHSKSFRELYFGLQDIEAFKPTSRIFGSRSLESMIGPLSNGIYALTFIYGFDEIALFNPVTKRIKFAASFPDECRPLLYSIGAASSSVSYGIDDDYRVVVLIEYERDGWNIRHCFLAFLYTWRTGEWEKLFDYHPAMWNRPQAYDVFEKAFNVKDNMMACSQKLLNGCWHWMIEQHFKEEGETRFGVLSFDFERKSLRLICGPPRKPTLLADVFVLQDHLASVVADNYNNPLLPRFEIWRKTKTTWTNIYSVNSTQFVMPSRVIVHDVDYYQVEEDVTIRRLILVQGYKRHIFDDDKGHQLEEFDHLNRKISLSVGGISKFTPTFESLPL